MSLKAKLEAVIYAAEEPVTLAQLAALFTADALEWKAEQEAASAARAAEAEDDASRLGEEFSNQELGLTAAEPAVEPVSEPVLALETPAEAVPAEGEHAVPESADGAAPDAEATSELVLEPAQSAEAPADAESEIRRQARLRDREVRGIIRQLLDELIATYVADSRGVEIREIAGGYRMATKPECHDAVRLFVKSLTPPLKLSLPALETLAVVAYKQPVTAPEVSEIRGVESGGVLGSLLSRKLIATSGRKQVIGRPILYKTTKEFLLRFGLKDLSELPSMEEFEKMAAVEIDESEPAEEGDLLPATTQESAPQGDETNGEEGANKPAGDAAPETIEATETAVTADDVEPPAPASSDESLSPETLDSAGSDPAALPAAEPTQADFTPPATAGTPETDAEQTPAEAAPAAPSYTEQAETENFPHGR
jgi:segregation and condensation protein B